MPPRRPARLTSRGGKLACADCHQHAASGHFAASREGVGERICTNCHDVVDDYTSAHVAYREGRCLECHSAMSPAHLYRDGSVATERSCLACHGEIAALLEGAARVSAGPVAEDGSDLHARHLGLRAERENWCGACHSSHGSDAPGGLILLDGAARATGADRAARSPMRFEPAGEGGRCSGGCHEGRSGSYRRAGGETR